MSEKEFWQKKFACGDRYCKGQLIPLELHDNKKQGNVKAIGKCPVCKKTWTFSLPSDKETVEKWAPYIFDQMFTCTTCGSKTLKQVNLVINPKTGYKIDVKCTRCNQPGERNVDAEYFHLIGNRVLEITSREVTRYCPNCGKPVPSGSIKCPSCGVAVKK
ncbi:MAG TPA: zinc ribbon domain-containing protein [Candidatus Lokiarchaeia archaeon]|nr:zinc ribbon domain-containing protein [Candidatus Lokiarchaeia archaeon]